MAREAGKDKITVNAIAITYDRYQWHKIHCIRSCARKHWHLGAIQGDLLLSDIDGMGGYLASDAARFTTGQVMVIDGGRL